LRTYMLKHEKQLDVKLKAQKKHYDRKLRERSFEVGEKVLWLCLNVAGKCLAVTLRGGQQAGRVALLHVKKRC
jgi:hypothetical protein